MKTRGGKGMSLPRTAKQKQASVRNLIKARAQRGKTTSASEKASRMAAKRLKPTYRQGGGPIPGISGAFERAVRREMIKVIAGGTTSTSRSSWEAVRRVGILNTKMATKKTYRVKSWKRTAWNR
jgi:hypothetical protein